MDKQQNDAIDAVAMKRRIQEQIYEETRHLAPAEFIAYMHKRIANSQFADFLTRADVPQSPADPGKIAR
jgi:hypothetical protein